MNNDENRWELITPHYNAKKWAEGLEGPSTTREYKGCVILSHYKPTKNKASHCYTIAVFKGSFSWSDSNVIDSDKHYEDEQIHERFIKAIKHI